MDSNNFFEKKCEPKKWTAAAGVRTRELGRSAERCDGLDGDQTKNVSTAVSARPFGACRSRPLTSLFNNNARHRSLQEPPPYRVSFSR